MQITYSPLLPPKSPTKPSVQRLSTALQYTPDQVCFSSSSVAPQTINIDRIVTAPPQSTASGEIVDRVKTATAKLLQQHQTLSPKLFEAMETSGYGVLVFNNETEYMAYLDTLPSSGFLNGAYLEEHQGHVKHIDSLISCLSADKVKQYYADELTQILEGSEYAETPYIKAKVAELKGLDLSNKQHLSQLAETYTRFVYQYFGAIPPSHHFAEGLDKVVVFEKTIGVGPEDTHFDLTDDERLPNVLAHETRHFVSRVIGKKSIGQSFALDPKFEEHYNTDWLAAQTHPELPKPNAMTPLGASYDYYLPYTPPSNPEELFAEVGPPFHTGGACNRDLLQKLFPTTIAYTQKMVLDALDQKA